VKRFPAILILILILTSQGLPMAQGQSPTFEPTLVTVVFDTPTPVPELPSPTASLSPTPAPPTPTSLPTPTPSATPDVSGRIVDSGADVAFPMAIRFTAVLDEPITDYQSLSLTLNIPGLQDWITLRPADASWFDPEDPTRLAVTWQVTPDQMPPLFGTITYTWELLDSQGDFSRAIGQVDYFDRRAQWIRQSSDDGLIVLYSADRTQPAVLDRLQSMGALLGRSSVEQPIARIILYPEEMDIGCRKSDGPDGTVTRSTVFDVSGVVIGCDVALALGSMEAARITPIQESDALAVDMAAFHLRQYFPGMRADSDTPDWWLAGLAQFFSGQPPEGSLITAQRAARANATLSLAGQNSPREAVDPEIWDVQAYGLVLYVFDQIGLDGLLSFLAEVEADGFEAAYARQFAVPLERQIADWSRWIFTDDAAAIYSISPYAAPTATPTASLTPSATFTSSPTDTATASPTITLTPSSTLTFTRTPTVPPTLAAPTHTPRPMAVLLTPTPSAANASASTGEGTLRSAVVIVMVIIIGVLIVLLLRTFAGRSRGSS